MLICPVCGSRGIGKVGIGQYYCKDCCVEFAYKRNQLKIYTLGDDGSLVQYAKNNSEIVSKTG